MIEFRAGPNGAIDPTATAALEAAVSAAPSPVLARGGLDGRLWVAKDTLDLVRVTNVYRRGLSGLRPAPEATRGLLVGRSLADMHQPTRGSAPADMWQMRPLPSSDPVVSGIVLVERDEALEQQGWWRQHDAGADGVFEFLDDDGKLVGETRPLKWAGRPVFYVDTHGMPGMASLVRTGDTNRAWAGGAQLAELVSGTRQFRDAYATHGSALNVVLVVCKAGVVDQHQHSQPGNPALVVRPLRGRVQARQRRRQPRCAHGV